MLLLALETSSLAGSVALVEDGVCRAAAEFDDGGRQGRAVLVQSKKLIAGIGCEPSALDGIAVGRGPGSYTGIRVGVTAAKTLSLALRCPLVAESSLRVMACNPLLDPTPTEGQVGFIATILDGRQEYLYGGLFRVGPPAALREDPGAAADCLLSDRVSDASELQRGFVECLEEKAGREAPRVFVVGDGADLFLDRIGAASGGRCVFERGPREWDTARAEALGYLATPWARATSFDPEVAHNLNPAYLRPTEAERKLMAR
jgi:tRNA threonylcarbamoyladenosine biosynthesis protein TsaB